MCRFAAVWRAHGSHDFGVCIFAYGCQATIDERHVRYQDAHDLKTEVYTEYNIEGNPIPKFIDLVSVIKPDQVTLVPDAEDAITSNAGWDCVKHHSFLRETIDEFHTRLRGMSRHCQFHDVDREIKSQIIQKCRSEKVREKGLADPTINLEDLVKFGRNLELTRTCGGSMKEYQGNMSMEVHKMGISRQQGRHPSSQPPRFQGQRPGN